LPYEPKDARGTTLQVGDEVVFCLSGTMIFGTIDSFGKPLHNNLQVVMKNLVWPKDYYGTKYKKKTVKYRFSILKL